MCFGNNHNVAMNVSSIPTMITIYLLLRFWRLYWGLHQSIDARRNRTGNTNRKPYKFPICYIVVGSYSFRNQGKVLISGFHNGFAYKSPYIVGLFRYTHRIPSGNNTTTSDLRQCETRTFVERSYAEIVRSQKGTFRPNELGSEGFFPATSAQWYGC